MRKWPEIKSQTAFSRVGFNLLTVCEKKSVFTPISVTTRVMIKSTPGLLLIIILIIIIIIIKTKRLK
jgi:hypothetical protein